MRAMTHSQPKSASLILEAINSLNDPEDQKAILMQTDREGKNALMRAMTHSQPEFFSLILEAINNLDDPAARKAILMQTDREGKNVLVYAEKRSHSKFAAFIESIASLSIENLESEGALLEDISKERLFKVIKTLPEDRQIDLLKKSLDPNNILGHKMWMPRIVGTECSLERGTLKAINDHLKTLTDSSATTDQEQETEHSELTDSPATTDQEQETEHSEKASVSDDSEYPELADDIPLRARGAIPEDERARGMEWALSTTIKQNKREDARPLHEAIKSTITALQRISIPDSNLTQTAVSALHFLQELLLNRLEHDTTVEAETMSQMINELGETLVLINKAAQDSGSIPRFSVFSTNDTPETLSIDNIQSAWTDFKAAQDKPDSDDVSITEGSGGPKN